MLTKPILVAQTVANMSTLLTMGKQVLGHSISRGTDGHGLQKPVQRFLSSLSEVVDESADANKLLSSLGLLADHYTYTFGLIVSDAVYADLILYRQLHIIGQNTTQRGFMFAIATSSLRGWRESIIDGSCESVQSDVRDTFNELYKCLCDEGLTKMWSDYSKARHNDGTLLLIEN